MTGDCRWGTVRRKVGADESIVFVFQDVVYTCSILKALESTLENDLEKHYQHFCNAIKETDIIVKDCLGTFHETGRALSIKIRERAWIAVLFELLLSHPSNGRFKTLKDLREQLFDRAVSR